MLNVVMPSVVAQTLTLKNVLALRVGGLRPANDDDNLPGIQTSIINFCLANKLRFELCLVS